MKNLLLTYRQQVDANGTYSDVNRKFEAFTGFDRNTLIGKNYKVVLPEERVDYSAGIRRQFLQGLSHRNCC